MHHAIRLHLAKLLRSVALMGVSSLACLWTLQTQAQVEKTAQDTFTCAVKTDPKVPLMVVIPSAQSDAFLERGFERILCPADTAEIERSYRGFCREGREVAQQNSDRMKARYGVSYAELCAPVKTWLRADKVTAKYATTGRRIFKQSKGDAVAEEKAQ